MNNNRVYLSESEVMSKVGNTFAREKVSFAGWNIDEIKILPSGIGAAALVSNRDMKIEMEVRISTRHIPIFFIRGKKSRKIDKFTSLREALAS